MSCFHIFLYKWIQHIFPFVSEYLHESLSEIDFGVCATKKSNRDYKCFLLLTFIKCFHVITFKDDGFFFSQANQMSFLWPKSVLRTVPDIKKKKKSHKCALVCTHRSAVLGMSVAVLPFRWPELETWNYTAVQESGWRQRSNSNKEAQQMLAIHFILRLSRVAVWLLQFECGIYGFYLFQL